MLLGQWTMSLLGAILAMSLPCSAFTADRSGGVDIPPSGQLHVSRQDTIPPPSGRIHVPRLETQQKLTTVDHVPIGRTPVTSSGRLALQASDTRKSTQTVSQDAERDRRDSVLGNVENDTTRFTKTVKFAAINDETTVGDSIVSSPRNAILLLVAESEQDRTDLWKDFRASHSFPVEGHLQSCHNNQIEAAWFPLDKALVSGSKDKECDCERYLRSNVATLLLWARDVKGMTTGTLFNSNFTVPSLFGHEEPVSVPEEINELDANMKLNIRQAKPEIRSDWYMIDLGKPVDHASLVQFPPSSRGDDAEDPAWNIFDVFSRVRMALFRSLLESLGRNVAGSEESIPLGRSRPSSPSLADIVREVKSIRNQKGFLLVAATPASELDSAVATLLREVPQDVLVVVSGVCRHDAKPIPFFAKGPAAKMLREVTTIWDLPTTIKNIIANGCEDPGSKIRRQAANSLPVDQSKTVPEKEDVLKRTLQDSEKTVQSNGSDADATSATDDSSKKVRFLDAKEGKKEESKESLSNIIPRNSAESDMRATTVTTVLGTILSVLVTFTFAS